MKKCDNVFEQTKKIFKELYDINITEYAEWYFEEDKSKKDIFYYPTTLVIKYY